MDARKNVGNQGNVRKPYEGKVRCHLCQAVFTTAAAWTDHLPCAGKKSKENACTTI